MSLAEKLNGRAPNVVASIKELINEAGTASLTAHLDSERDQNFRLRTTDGRDYVLKIANPAEERSVTNLQTEVLRHVASRDPSLPIPRIFFVARDGKVVGQLIVEEDLPRYLRQIAES